MAVPIWKDYFVNLGSVASQYFRLRVNNNTIYQGRAYRAASSGNLYVRINDVCADYMAQKPAPVPYSAQSLQFPVSFKVQKSSNGSTWTDVETVAFNDDWTYDPNFDPSSDGMSFPITGRIDPRMEIWQTRYASGAVSAVFHYEGGGSQTVSVTPGVPGTNDAFADSLRHAGNCQADVDVATYETYGGKALQYFTMGDVTYTVTKKCARYVLWYKSPFGGYDFLLLEGRVTENRTGKRDQFVADYDNTKVTREEWTFSNELTRRFTCNTGLLTDEESARMRYLLDSTDVYFVDLLSPSVYVPATIVTDSYQVQRHINGSGEVNYQFEIAVAQKQYRR